MNILKPTLRLVFRIIRIKLTFAVFIMLPLVVFTLLTSQTNVFAGMKSYVVVSGSMEPAIPVGSIIYTKSQDFYSEKDVIAFKKDSEIISHRIVNLKAIGNELYYTTKGDANNVTDGDLVARGDIVGKTFFFVPYLGKAVMSLKTPIGFSLGIVLPALFFTLSELWNIKNEIVKEAERKILDRIGAV